MVGGLFAAGAAYLVGKLALGLRSDYLAIATLGIAEIILAILKNENWLTRGVKNVTGLPRPIPDERVLQGAPGSSDLAEPLRRRRPDRRRHRLAPRLRHPLRGRARSRSSGSPSGR